MNVQLHGCLCARVHASDNNEMDEKMRSLGARVGALRTRTSQWRSRWRSELVSRLRSTLARALSTET